MYKEIPYLCSRKDLLNSKKQKKRRNYDKNGI